MGREYMIDQVHLLPKQPAMTNTFKTLSTLTVGGETLDYYSLPALERAVSATSRGCRSR